VADLGDIEKRKQLGLFLLPIHNFSTPILFVIRIIYILKILAKSAVLVKYLNFQDHCGLSR